MEEDELERGKVSIKEMVEKKTPPAIRLWFKEENNPIWTEVPCHELEMDIGDHTFLVEKCSGKPPKCGNVYGAFFL